MYMLPSHGGVTEKVPVHFRINEDIAINLSPSKNATEVGDKDVK